MPINLTELLTPISEASPCGDDLLFSAEFDAIQHARKFDDPSLDQGEWITDIKEADWGFVVEQSSTLLRERTKDLRLAVWLTEALALEDGIGGLTQGYELLTNLCRQFWDHVHPLPDGDDAEYRLGNVAWLAGRTVALLRAVPLTDGASNAFSELDWDVAQHACARSGLRATARALRSSRRRGCASRRSACARNRSRFATPTENRLRFP